METLEHSTYEVRTHTGKARRTGGYEMRIFVFLWAAFFILLGVGAYGAGIAPRGVEVMVSAMREKMKTPAAPAPAQTETPRASPLAALYTSYASEEQRIVIPAIGVNAPIVIPPTTDATVMNLALMKGVVKYPSPHYAGEEGNILFFGHSSGLHNVQNKNFQVFNDIKKLEKGDVIKIRSSEREYIYIVTSVSVKPANDAKIELETTGKKLTLSTCDVFGNLEDRYIVEADFLGSYPLRTTDVL